MKVKHWCGAWYTLAAGALLTAACDDATGTPAYVQGAATSDTGPVDETGGSGGGSPGTRTMLGACREYFRQVCLRRDRCTEQDESPDACLANIDGACPDHFFAPGSARTADELYACAGEIANLDCDLVLRGVPPACSVAGTLPVGDPCISPVQCASRRCSGSAEACGQCIASVPAGSACEPAGDPCEPGYECDTGTLLCVETTLGPVAPPDRVGPGESCIHDGNCLWGQFCLDTDENANLEVCQAPREVGGPCTYDGGDPAERCAPGAYCDSANLLCVAQPALDEPCGYDASNVLIDCAPGLYCDLAAGTQGTCVARQAAGSPCIDPATDLTAVVSNCLEDLRCNREGVCAPFALAEQTCVADTFCEPQTACVDGVCTDSGGMLLYESLCGAG